MTHARSATPILYGALLQAAYGGPTPAERRAAAGDGAPGRVRPVTMSSGEADEARAKISS